LLDVESLPPEQVAFFQEAIMKWGQANYAIFPWRQTDNHWHALVAEIMLQ
jgi:A/G-specific adenine glycosylase